MHSDVGAPVLGGFNGRPQLGLGERDRFERTMRRRYSSPSRQFDLSRTQHELLASPQSAFVRVVGEQASADLFHSSPRAAERARHVKRLAENTVTTRYRDEGAGTQSAGAHA